MEEIQELLQYSSIFQDDHLIGYFCTGEFAQIPFGRDIGAYPDTIGLIDLGIGLKPDLTGQGLGKSFLTFIINYLLDEYNPKIIRLSVADFNQRAIKLYENLGFSTQSSFEANNTNFLVMTKKV